MTKNNMRDSLNKMSEKDIYTLLLYLVYRLSEDEEYSTLSYLIWALDKENLLNFLRMFENTTIKVPSIADLKSLTTALDVYRRVDINEEDLSSVLEDTLTEDFTKETLMELYRKIKVPCEEFLSVKRETAEYIA